MMDSMMKLPDDMFRLELIPYLSVDDVVKLDNSCMNHKYRPQLLEKISGVILIGDKDRSVKASLFKWLGMRRIYLIKMLLVVSDFYLTPFGMENNYVDQFKYTQYLVMSGTIRDDMAIFTISHCPCLLSIDINSYCYGIELTDHTLKSIAEHCTVLQSILLRDCRAITDTGLMITSEHCPNLLSLKVNNCNQITDASIISISIQCTGLQSLNLQQSNRLTDTSIISVSIHCTRLQSLNLYRCYQLTDASILSISTHCIGLLDINLFACNYLTDVSIISISTHCTGLQSLDLGWCTQITDACITSISFHCIALQALNLRDCNKISDASIISVSTQCTGLKGLNIPSTNITDASLIAIAKYCTALQSLHTFRCNRLSTPKLRNHFKSVSELRVALMSIDPPVPASRLSSISSCIIQ